MIEPLPPEIRAFVATVAKVLGIPIEMPPPPKTYAVPVVLEWEDGK